MKLFAHDSSNGDWLVVDRRFVLEGDPLTVVATRIVHALNLCKGEWAFNENAGLAYYPLILGAKAPSLGDIKSLVTAYLESLEGVSSVGLDLSFNEATRVLSFSGYALTIYGRLDLAQVLAGV